MNSNIKPVREYLRTTDKDDEQTNTLRSLIFLDLRGASGSGSSRVACSSPGMKRAATSNLGIFSSDTRANEGPLANILTFLPLKEAFGEYCQKALCSEVHTHMFRHPCVNVVANLEYRQTVSSLFASLGVVMTLDSAG